MFKRPSSRSLKLQIAGSTYEFDTPEDLAFALAGRAGIPGTRISALVEMNDLSLRREAEAIRHVEQAFNDALDGSLQDVTSISPFLKEIDLNLISQDHDWRAIIASLNTTSEPHEAFKQVALVKYVQYLAARRQAVTAIYSLRRDKSQTENVQDSDSKLRETAIFDVTELAPADEEPFARIPKGETVEIEIDPDSEVSILLAKHRCRLKNAGGKIVFIDDGEQITQLRRGKNIIGRDSSCDVLMNSSYREISRKHLILELSENTAVRVIDISSHGTSLNPLYLENTSI
ncbi:MAG: hypothetical protein ACI9DC_005080 [Gammaproteobacteria bacterium]|jgi:hypothetical protein